MVIMVNMRSGETYSHYQDIYRAISGDREALARIEQTYGRMDTLGDLHALGSKLFNLLTDEEREMDRTRVTLALHRVDDTIKEKTNN